MKKSSFFLSLFIIISVSSGCSSNNKQNLPDAAEADAGEEFAPGDLNDSGNVTDGDISVGDSSVQEESGGDSPEEASDQSGEDSGGCSSQPPADPRPAFCQKWTCVQAAPPVCWSCEHQPTLEGSACSGEGYFGVCRQGNCQPLADPGQSGQHQVDKLSLKVPAGTRPDSVEVPLEVYLPKDLDNTPVVVLGHGFQLDPGLYASYGQHLASWGYAGVIVKYSGSPLSPRVHRLLAVDLMAVLDWLVAQASSGGQLAGKIDPGKILLAGHSMGGKIAMLVAASDRRPWGVFGIDPVDAGGGPFGGDPVDYPSVTPELMGNIQVPLLILGETVNATCSGFGCQACAPEEENFHQYYLHAVTPACEVELVGADHMDFIDNPDCGLVCNFCPEGPADHQKVKLWTRRMLVAWLQVELALEDAYRVYIDGAAAIQAQNEGLIKFQCKNGF